MLLLFAYGVILFLIITRGWTTNVPKHIRAPRAVACDIFLLRVSAHHWHVSAFLCNREFQGISHYTKRHIASAMCLRNEASGIRTPDNLIKSQVLYRLS